MSQAVYKFKYSNGKMFYAALQKDREDGSLETYCYKDGDEYEYWGEDVPLTTESVFMKDMNMTMEMVLERVRNGSMHERAIAIAMELLL